MKDKQVNLEPLPRFLEGSLDPWTIEDDSMIMQSNFGNEETDRFTEDQMIDKGNVKIILNMCFICRQS